MVKKFHAVTLLFLIFIIAPLAVQAEERALNFDVIAQLDEDGSLMVTERIHVLIKQIHIRHGITHTYPIKEPYGDKKLRHYGFEILKATLDGQPIDYTSKITGAMLGTAIGREDTPAPLGEHVYEITYKTTGHVRFLPEHDELYYNVLGHAWEFPVDQASFTLILPHDQQDAWLKTTAFTGPAGQSGNDFILQGNNMVKTTRTLEPGEGLTIVMAWEKGLVRQPKESLANFLGAQRTPILLAILIVISAYFWGLRYLFNRSSQGVVVPIFSAPEGMSPGYMAVLKHMTYGGSMLQADIVWSAVNGFLNLDAREKDKFLIHKQDPLKAGHSPTWIKNQLLTLNDHLFQKGLEHIDLKDEAGQKAAADAFEYLQGEYQEQQKGFWKRSYLPGLLGLGLLFGLFSWALMYIYTPLVEPGSNYPGPFEFLAIQSSLVGLIGLFLFAIRKSWLDFEGLRAWLQIAVALLCVLGLSSVTLFILCPDPFFLAVLATTLGLAAWQIIFPPALIFSKGRQAYLQMRGLEMYIRTAETERLAKLNAPEDTLEKFEELLPYAIALGCAQSWQKRFNNILTDAQYAPSWLTVSASSGLTHYQALNYVTSVSGLQAATMASVKASQAQKTAADNDSRNSSGFSGGGSVGGGSGGSSVGGW